MRKLSWRTLFVVSAVVAPLLVAAGCGSESGDIAPPDVDAGDASDDGAIQPDLDSSTIPTSDASDAAADGWAPSDASLNEASTCHLTGQSCSNSGECCTANCDTATSTCAPPLTACKAPNEACAAPNECCTGSCVNGACADKQCVPDKPTAGACAQPGDCCSGICTNGTCASVNPGQTCRTAGNPCSAPSECCSNLCNGGICSGAVSFCTQQGEICSTNFECCGANCVKSAGAATGVCGPPTSGGAVPGCAPSGTLCTGASATDGGGACDQDCCSRACGQFGALSGFTVCQPPSGCRPTGEVCRSDSDCCGWSGAPDPVDGPVVCSKASSTAEFGRCNNGGSCREPGSICKTASDSCSAENNCCEHSSIGDSSYCNKNPANCCNKDALGIPRCLIKPVDCTGTDGGTPPTKDTVCATSADCCGAPCVNNKCGAAGSCIPKGETCTNSADCCPGIPCVQAPGSTNGVCGGTLLPDGGVTDPSPTDAGTSDGGSDGGSTADGGGGNLPDGGTCALYGQICSANGDCCNGVPCTVGRCRYP